MVYPQVLGNVEGKMLDLLPQTESRNEYVLDFRRMFFLEFLESKNKMLQIGQIQLLLIVHNGNEQPRSRYRVVQRLVTHLQELLLLRNITVC